MRAWGIDPDVTEALVRGDQEPLLRLGGLPQDYVLGAAHALPHDCVDVMACPSDKLSNLERQVLIDLDSKWQGLSSQRDDDLPLHDFCRVGQSGPDVLS